MSKQGSLAVGGTVVEGIDADGVTRWFAEHAPDAVAPLRFDLIAGGHSNLTYRVTDSEDRRWVLRRPPLGHVLATAHDMGREHRIIAALGPTDVPVPPVVGLCTDEAVNGSPFYVMGFVEGSVIRSQADAERLSTEQRRRASESIVDVMAAIHAVDVDEVGLGDLGRHDGYIERQLKRWYRQYQGSVELAPEAGHATVDRVHEVLASAIPPQQAVAIVHGDYRLDNCMLGDDGSIAAVLDWEICTLGDPLADLGLLWVYWADADGPAALPQMSPTALPGFLDKAQVVDRYAKASGLDVSGLDYYVTFGFWKLTCIIAGVYARYAAGAMGAGVEEAQVRGFELMLGELARLTEEATERIRG